MERRFSITVRGHLSSGLADLFGDVTMTVVGDQTIVSGCAIDQAHLEGILAHLRELGLEMVAVETRPGAVPDTRTGDRTHRPGTTSIQGDSR